MTVDLQIEHFAINVEDPVAVAQWYCKYFNMTVVRQGEGPIHMHFLADSSGRVLFELYTNPPELVPDYREQHPQILHIAFAVQNMAVTRQELINGGATAVGEIGTTPAGDRLAMLRDPWGFAVQLCQRKVPMG